MDPDVLLAEIRLLLDEVQNEPEDLHAVAEELDQKVRELDAWISGGGSLPLVWQSATPLRVVTPDAVPQHVMARLDVRCSSWPYVMSSEQWGQRDERRCGICDGCHAQVWLKANTP